MEKKKHGKVVFFNNCVMLYGADAHWDDTADVTEPMDERCLSAGYAIDFGNGQLLLAQMHFEREMGGE